MTSDSLCIGSPGLAVPIKDATFTVSCVVEFQMRCKIIFDYKSYNVILANSDYIYIYVCC